MSDLRDDGGHPEHANNHGSGHGGFLAALVDIATTRGAWLIVGGNGSVRTLSSNTDFVAPVAVGSWVEAAVSVDRAGHPHRLRFLPDHLRGFPGGPGHGPDRAAQGPRWLSTKPKTG